MAKKIVTIVGATGNQGISIINALSGKAELHLRGLTRNPSSDQAQALSTRGVEMVQADLDDPASIKSAFSGSHIIYAVTDFLEPFARLADAGEAISVETRQGITMAEAAAATPTLEQYIWSTLPDWDALAGGRHHVPHARGKADVDLHIRRELPGLAARTTFLWVTFYHANILAPVFRPVFVETAGAWVQIQTQDPDTPVLTIGDVRANAGRFVEAIVEQRARTGGKVVLAEVERTTSGRLLQSWADAKGVRAVYAKVDVAVHRALWPVWSEEVGSMIQAWEFLKEKSWLGAHGEEVLTKEDLGVTGLVGLDESYKSLEFPE